MIQVMRQKHSNVSLNYLLFCGKREELVRESGVTFQEVQYLRFIVHAFLENRPATVNDILTLSYLGSASTNHSVLKRLIKKNLVNSVQSPQDHRVKHLVPSVETFELFKKISKLFSKYSEDSFESA